MIIKLCYFAVRSQGCSPWAIVLLCCAVIAGAPQRSVAVTVDRYWEVSPYRIQITVRYETSAVWQARLSTELSEYIERRAHVAYGPLWKLSFEQMPAAVASKPSDQLVEMNDEQLAALRRNVDKLVGLVVSESKLGFEIAVQEYDCLLELWGPVRIARTRDPNAIGELAFSSIQTAFTPLATFQVIRETPDRVELRFRGAKLPRGTRETSLVSPGQVLQPVLRRIDRDGQPVENGIQAVPWTYFSVDSMEGELPTATIVSHAASPLGVRQRGRVDQVARLVTPSDRDTRLRLHARDDPSQPLAGFRVYQRDAGAEDQAFIGKTDDEGSIAIAPGNTPIQIAFVQSSGQWIAKIPLVPGADGLVQAPLADDRKRLEAEAKLVGIREELIDLVARRNILAARARAKLRANDIDEANDLVRILEQMPTATEFEQQRIRQQERLIRSSDPQIQRRIEQLFNDTRDVLAEFLAPGLVQELKREISAAGTTAQQ